MDKKPRKTEAFLVKKKKKRKKNGQNQKSQRPLQLTVEV